MTLEWSCFNINIGLNKDDKYQKVCRYLNMFKDGDKTNSGSKSKIEYDIRELLFSKTILSVDYCQGLL